MIQLYETNEFCFYTDGVAFEGAFALFNFETQHFPRDSETGQEARDEVTGCRLFTVTVGNWFLLRRALFETMDRQELERIEAAFSDSIQEELDNGINPAIKTMENPE